MDQIHSKGDYEVVWNGVSNLGETMGAGIYFLQFESDQFSKNNKITLIK
jgi:hypothetical protein